MRRTLALLGLISASLAGCGAVAGGGDTSRPAPAVAVRAQPSGETRQCLADLGVQKARFSALPDRYYGAGCSSLGSVSLTAVAGDRGDFQLTNLGPVACPLATRFAGWARFGVDRAAREILGSPLVRIETMGSYSCRTIAGSGKLSAHARAEAIDIAAFVLADGRRVSVIGGWGAGPQERAFLRTVHQSACKRFGTVLGPEYNAAHRDHFHLESGGGGFCR